MSSNGNPQLVDVSHTVEHGMITYKGLPAPVICDYLSREESRKLYSDEAEFHIGRIEMVANTGTYLDSPFHRYPDGKDLSQLLLGAIANLEGIVVHADTSHEQAIDVSSFRELDVKDKAVLVHTGWDTHWGSDQYFEGNPFLTSAAAQHLDDTRDLSRPAHSILLRSDIPIVEHLCNLVTLPREGFKFFAVPVKVKGMGTFPVRAFGVIQ
jgi:arylformamidase